MFILYLHKHKTECSHSHTLSNIGHMLFTHCRLPVTRPLQTVISHSQVFTHCHTSVPYCNILVTNCQSRSLSTVNIFSHTLSKVSHRPVMQAMLCVSLSSSLTTILVRVGCTLMFAPSSCPGDRRRPITSPASCTLSSMMVTLKQASLCPLSTSKFTSTSMKGT